MKTNQTTLAVLVAVLLGFSLNGSLGWGGQSDQSGQIPILPTDPWQAVNLFKPEDLARSLTATNSEKPLLLFVGYSLPYQGGHIPGSKFIGQASKPEGIQALIGEVQDQPRERQIVLYCGCCPWDKCPDICRDFEPYGAWGSRISRCCTCPTGSSRIGPPRGFRFRKATTQNEAPAPRLSRRLFVRRATRLILVLQDLVNPLEQILPCRRFLDESALSAVEHLTWDAIVGGTHPQDPGPAG